MLKSIIVCLITVVTISSCGTLSGAKNKEMRQFKKCAKKAQPSCMYQYGVFLYENSEKEKNKIKGLQYLKDAANLGDLNSLKYLCFENPLNDPSVIKKFAYNFNQNENETGNFYSHLSKIVNPKHYPLSDLEKSILYYIENKHKFEDSNIIMSSLKRRVEEQFKDVFWLAKKSDFLTLADLVLEYKKIGYFQEFHIRSNHNLKWDGHQPNCYYTNYSFKQFNNYWKSFFRELYYSEKILTKINITNLTDDEIKQRINQARKKIINSKYEKYTRLIYNRNSGKHLRYRDQYISAQKGTWKSLNFDYTDPSDSYFNKYEKHLKKYATENNYEHILRTKLNQVINESYLRLIINNGIQVFLEFADKHSNDIHFIFIYDIDNVNLLEFIEHSSKRRKKDFFRKKKYKYFKNLSALLHMNHDLSNLAKKYHVIHNHCNVSNHRTSIRSIESPMSKDVLFQITLSDELVHQDKSTITQIFEDALRESANRRGNPNNSQERSKSKKRECVIKEIIDCGTKKCWSYYNTDNIKYYVVKFENGYKGAILYRKNSERWYVSDKLRPDWDKVKFKTREEALSELVKLCSNK